MDLPYPEDIYDFGEAELTLWQHKVREALSSYVPGSNDKWERKALRVVDLIQTELDERVSIAQISHFCLKELNSKLYQDIHSEEIAPNPSSEPTSRCIDPIPTATPESESTQLPSEGSVASSQGAWMSRGRMSKKEYQDFIKEKLRSTQVSAGVVIGGSSVPQAKPQAARTKSAERSKGETDKPLQSGKKSDRTKETKPFKQEKPLNSAHSSSKPTEEEKKPAVGKKSGKTTGSPMTPVKKQQESRTQTIKSHVNQAESGREIGGKQADLKPEKGVLPDRNEGKSTVVKGERPLKPVGENKVAQSEKIAVSTDIPKLESAKAEPEVVKSEAVSMQQAASTLSTPSISAIPQGNPLPTVIQVNTTDIPSPRCTQIALLAGTPDTVRTDLEGGHTEKPYIEVGNTEESRELEGDNASEEEAKSPVYLQTTDLPSSRKSSSADIPPVSVLSLSKPDPYINPQEEIKPSFFPILQPAVPLFPSNSSTFLESEEKKAGPGQEDDTEEETEESPEPVISFSIGKSVITSDSNLPPVTLKPKPAAIPQELFNISDTQREGKEGILDGKRQASAAVKQLLTDQEENAVSSASQQIAASIAPSNKPPKPQSRPPRPKPPSRPKPALPASKPPLPITDDYSDVYHSIADLYNGGRSKDFDLLGAVRNSLSMFQDLENLMSAPDFEFQRSFKFALAPLEMDPRDFVRNGGRLEMDTSVVRPPSEKEMYYRVVRAKQEVYDIVTRSFLKKSGWTELPHGMSLRCSWNIMWTWSKPCVDFTKLFVWQRVNHFPNSKQFSRKDYLKRNIERIAKQSSKCAQVWNIIPATFLLPKEYVAFCDEFAKNAEEEGNYWIMKPVGKSRGRGISLVKDITEVTYSEPMVIQRYLKHPLLLSGFKFDLRIYVLITALNPLEVFLYKEGFARMSTVQYTLNPDKLANKFVHLTNSSIQKHNPNSQTDPLDHSFGGTKISLETLKQRLQFQGINFDIIWQQIREIIVKSLLAVQSEMDSTPSSFDLVGFDVLIDGNLKAWLIEINSSPSLARDNVLDDMVKQTLIDDTLDLINPLPFNRKKMIKVLERRVGELQKGNVGSVSQLNADVAEILDGCKVRRYGEMPEKLGLFERIAPSPLLEQLQKVMKGS